MTGELLVSDHGSAIEDPECDKGIPIQWQDEDVPNMREFDAVAQRVLALEPVIVTVRVTGKMSKASRSVFFDEPYWYLDLVSADVLSVREGS